MTKEFVVPLSNCFNEFEKEFYLYFEDSDELQSWLVNTYSFHVCGHEEIDYVDVSTQNGEAWFEIKIRKGYLCWMCYPAGSAKIKNESDLEDEVMARIKEPDKYIKR